jgi:hypothetical protein
MQEFYEGNEFTDRIRCRSREKEECLELVEKIIKYSIFYKEEGSDFLAQELKDIEDSFLYLGIELLLDKTDPFEVQSILTRHILAGDYHGKEFLQKMIIVEGVHAIQLGFSDSILIEVLLSLFGEDYLLENKSENYADNLLNQIIEYSIFYRGIKKAVLPNIETTIVTPKEFRKLLLCDSKGIQKIVREIDNIFIVRAIKNLDLNFKKLFYENILERSSKLLFQKEKETEVSLEEEIEARSRILFILNKLIQSGEITLEGSDYGLFL